MREAEAIGTADPVAVPATPRGAAGRLLRTGLRLAVGTLLGAITAVVGATYLVGLGLVLLVVWDRPGTRPTAAGWIRTGARHLAEVERWRLAAFLGSETSADYTDRQAVRYLTLRCPVGLLGGFVLLLFGWGVLAGAVWVWEVFQGESGPLTFLGQLLLGLVGLFLVVQGAIGLAGLERRLGRRFLGPTGREVLERRIAELASSRAGVVAAVDAERRRIERDLHDGVQQRLVALGMLVGRARRSADPEQVRDLMRQAHEESGQILEDLREVAWRVYPTALDNLGLDEALARVAERSGVPVRIRYRLTARPPRPVETAAYFVISEAVTNAAKHAGASLVTVDVAPRGDLLVLSVVDDGAGGADPSGAGLSGLARRAAALDGRFRVQSPPGGPTTVTAELPCG